jgi:hypothetical protein
VLCSYDTGVKGNRQTACWPGKENCTHWNISLICCDKIITPAFGLVNLRKESGYLSRYTDWAAGRTTKDQDSIFEMWGDISVLHGVQTGSGALTIQRISGTVYPSVQLWKRKGDSSHPPSAEVKNAWIYTSNLPYLLRAWYWTTFCVPLRIGTSNTNRISFNTYGLWSH